MLREPRRLEQTITRAIESPFEIASHAHERLLQLDLFVGCRGEAMVGRRRCELSGVTALTAYPGLAHGYRLTPGEPPSRVYHLRIDLTRRRKLIEDEPFAELVPQLQGADGLVAAMRVIHRWRGPEAHRPLVAQARLVEAFCLWPRGPRRAGAADPLAGPVSLHALEAPEEADRELLDAVAMIDRRLDDPPTLAEMARQAHFSPRHFSRRFVRVFGCTPQAYVTDQRLAWAKQLLAEDRLTITQIARRLGFDHLAGFSRWFGQHTGRPPSAFRADPAIM